MGRDFKWYRGNPTQNNRASYEVRSSVSRWNDYIGYGGYETFFTRQELKEKLFELTDALKECKDSDKETKICEALRVYAYLLEECDEEGITLDYS